MKVKREINGQAVEIELTHEEMCLAYDEIRREKWEAVILDQIEKNSDNLRFTDSFDENDFFGECMDEMERAYCYDDYDVKAEEIVFEQAELNDIWVEDDEDE